jgi:hypothetical protein
VQFHDIRLTQLQQESNFFSQRNKAPLVLVADRDKSESSRTPSERWVKVKGDTLGLSGPADGQLASPLLKVLPKWKRRPAAFGPSSVRPCRIDIV